MSLPFKTRKLGHLRKENGDKNLSQIYLKECVYIEKKPEQSNIKRKLVVPE